MAVRASMSDLITFTKRLVDQTAASTPWTEQQIQDQLDQHRTHFDFILMDHDTQYNYFYTRSFHPEYNPSRLASQNTIKANQYTSRVLNVPDFSLYTQVGFLESDVGLYQGRDTTYAAHTPDDSNLNDGTFIFSTAPDVDLYMFGKGYNVYAASADLLMETPDFGRLPLKSESRGQVSQTIDWSDKISMYYTRGSKLNRRITKLLRA
jgi:hypothetical protein